MTQMLLNYGCTVPISATGHVSSETIADVIPNGVPLCPTVLLQVPDKIHSGSSFEVVSGGYDPDDGVQPGAGITSAHWRVCDGSGAEVASAVGMQTELLILQAGSFEVRLTLTDNEGQSSCRTKTIEVFPPVVLVPGWNAPPSGLNEFAVNLQNAGFPARNIWVADNLDPCGVPGEVGFDRNASRLADFINQKAIENEYEGEAINIVAHSMGGLIARRLIVQPESFGFNFRVDNLIMLGTPNSGSPLGGWAPARWMCPSGPAWWELSTEYMLALNSVFEPRERIVETQYHVFAGDGACLFGPGSWFNIGCGLVTPIIMLCPHDGLVPVGSVFGVPHSVELAVLGRWCHGRRTSLYLGLHYLNDPDLVADYVYPILTGATVPAPEANNPAAIAEIDGPAEAVQGAKDVCDTLVAGGTVSKGAYLDGSEACLAVYSPNPNVSVQVRSPSGIIFDSASAAGNVSYVSDEITRAFFLGGGFEVGLWIVYVTAPTGGDVAEGFCFQALVRSGVVATGAMRDDYVFAGDSAVVRIEITEAGIPKRDARGDAGLKRGDSLISFASLYDDGLHNDDGIGDGIYGAVLYPESDSIGYEIETLLGGFTSEGDVYFRVVKNAIYVMPGSTSRGDLNRDGTRDLIDVVLLADYTLRDGMAPLPKSLADVNCDGVEDVFDIVGLVDYVFRGLPEPSCP